MKCARCSAPLPAPPYFRNDECPKCGGDLHSCIQCLSYEPGRDNDCAEVQAERVVDKERSNFCDWFKATSGDGSAAGQDKQSTIDALNSLFKK